MTDAQPVLQPPGDVSAGTPLADLEATVVALACELFAVESRFLAALAEFDRRDGWAGAGMRSCAHWLNWRCGMDLHTARERLRVARRLAQLPRIAAAFSRGEVSYSKVRVMTRVATADNEQTLLELAHASSASQLERIVRGTEQAQEDADNDREMREREGRPEPDPLADVLSRRYLPDGRVEYRLVVSAEDDALIFGALRAAMAEAEEGTAGDADDDGAQAPAEDCGNVPAGTSTDPPSRPDDVPAGTSDVRGGVVGPLRRVPRRWRPFDERAGAAMVVLAESFLASGPQARRSDERYQVHVHVDADVLAGLREPDLFSHARIEDGPALPVPVLRRIACDALLVGIVEQGDVNGTAAVGSPTRHIPRWMRRALKARDGGCRFPGCTERTWVDAHHIWHWAEGGPTELWNLVLLCRFHHGQVHDQGFRLTLLPSGRLEVRTADGAVIEAVPPLPGASAAFASRQVDEPAGVWRGGPWDLGLAVDAVLNATARCA